VVLYVGLDGGGSKTRAVVAGPDLVPLGRGGGPPSNASRMSLSHILEVVQEAVAEALNGAGATLEDLVGLCCGLAGIEVSGMAERVQMALARSFRMRITLATDARIALAAATQGPVDGPGIVLISGTGAIAFGRRTDGREARAGGWGPLLGDEGSGYAIAREGLSAVLRDFDGRGPATLLRSTVLTSEGVSAPSELLQRVLRDSRPSEIAAFFPLVLDAARKGDEVALGIFQRAGAELALAVTTVVRELGMAGESFAVATVGGVFESGELVLAPIRSALARAAPRANLAPAAYPPEIGAIRIAIAEEARTGQA